MARKTEAGHHGLRAPPLSSPCLTGVVATCKGHRGAGLVLLQEALEASAQPASPKVHV